MATGTNRERWGGGGGIKRLRERKMERQAGGTGVETGREGCEDRDRVIWEKEAQSG